MSLTIPKDILSGIHSPLEQVKNQAPSTVEAAISLAVVRGGSVLPEPSQAGAAHALDPARVAALIADPLDE